MSLYFPRALCWVACLAGLSACSPGASSSDPQAQTEEEPQTAPAGSVMPDLVALAAPAPGEVELLANGLFDQGTSGWTQSSRRSQWGTAGAIIGELPAGVPPPLNGRSTLARLCGYATELNTGTERSSGTCNDFLSAPITVPAASRNLTVRASAWASYACPADQRGALLLALTPLDGLGNPVPRATQFKELQLPAGSWQDLSITLTSVPGLETQARSLKLTWTYSTFAPCKPPLDSGTYVLLTDLSVRIQP